MFFIHFFKLDSQERGMVIANQTVIILLCLFQRLVKNLKKPIVKQVSQQIKVEQTVLKQPEAPKNDPADQLRARKKQIESTIEQFNNPSTFAKYSKMKRQLIKIQSQIKQLQQSSPNQLPPRQKNEQATSSDSQQSKQQQQSPPSSSKVSSNLLPQWFGIVFNIVIICLALTMSTNILPNHNQIPLSFLTDSTGKANCIWVYLACKMILI